MKLWQHREIWYLLMTLALALLLGIAIGIPFLFVAVVLTAYAVQHLRNVRKLHTWLTVEQSPEVPEAHGLWGDIFHELFLREKQRSADKYRLASMLSRFQEAANVFPDGMVIMTSEDKIEWANPTARDMMGIAIPKDVGRPITNLFRHPDFFSYLKKEDYSKELTLPSQERSESIITVQVIPFGFGRKLLIARDVTHVVNLEEMRSTFVANVSHELRTPVTVICGYLETINDMPELSKEILAQPITTMYSQARRMDQLVRDLLALARLETEPVHKEKANIDIAAMLASLRESALLLGGSKQQNIVVDADRELMLFGRRDELQSLFSNLINNAVRYTQAGGIIHVLWYKLETGEPVFTVQDNGPGIAAEHIPHLTERFYRVNADRSRETGGTGLGLAIVKHVLERHGGELRISSTPGKGSEFTCIFPALSALRRSA